MCDTGLCLEEGVGWGVGGGDSEAQPFRNDRNRCAGVECTTNGGLLGSASELPLLHMLTCARSDSDDIAALSTVTFSSRGATETKVVAVTGSRNSHRLILKCPLRRKATSKIPLQH